MARSLIPTRHITTPARKPVVKAAPATQFVVTQHTFRGLVKVAVAKDLGEATRIAMSAFSGEVDPPAIYNNGRMFESVLRTVTLIEVNGSEFTEV